MDVRVGLLFLFVLSAKWVSDARQLITPDLSRRNGVISNIVMQINNKSYQSGMLDSKTFKNDNVCTYCKEFATEAFGYLSENKTQTEIINKLHLMCSRVPSFKQECITLVDYYAPLFFLEISSMQPEEFCQKVNLCQQMVAFFSQLREDSCGLCHYAVLEILTKLEDPDTQLEIIKLLLKGCDSMENYMKKCKIMVFKYGPLILANAEQFLESNDVCIMLHACNNSTLSTPLRHADS